jgi:hypothetical protein
VRGSCPAVALLENSFTSVLVGAEDVRGVKTVVGETVVGVVTIVEQLGGPGVHNSCSNDRFELMETHPSEDSSKGRVRAY